MVEEILDKDYSELTNEGLVFTDFWATWCGPCRMQSPAVEALAEDNDDIKFFKMDVDENPETPNSLGIKAIPTMTLKKDGEVVETIVGYHSKEQLAEIVNKYR